MGRWMGTGSLSGGGGGGTRLRGEGWAGFFGAEMSRNCREGCLNKDSLDVALQFEMEMKRFYGLRNWDTSDLFSSV